MPRTFEFLYDFASPASYLAWTQLPALARRSGARAALRPILLGGVFKGAGNASPAMIPAKRDWILDDLALWAARYGVTLTISPHFPINSLSLMRGATALRDQPRFVEYCDLCFNAIWRDGRNLGDPAVTAAALEGAGFSAAEFAKAIADPAVKARLKADTEAAVARGVFGAPTYFVGESMFFGQDRQDFVAAALARLPA